MDIKALINFVRKKSAFYKKLYESSPKTVTKLEQLPVVNQDDFWEANSLENNQLLTGPMTDGIILRSGGTTGRPKFSVFSKNEWDAFIKDFAKMLPGTGLVKGDRVANLFYSGELYGSFLFTHEVLGTCRPGVLSLPIGGSAPVSEIVKILIDFKVTALAALPTSIMSIISFLESEKTLQSKVKIRLILFAGESLYPDQRERAQKVFPGVKINSIGYASNDAGFLGYVDSSCGPDEFRRHDHSTIYEILDEETGRPIVKERRPGTAVVTDRRRLLMPIIRYPVGDRAMWIESAKKKDRKFQLLGRSEESARVASISLYFEDVRALLETFNSRLGSFAFQLVVEHEDSRDRLTICIGVPGGRCPSPSLGEEIIKGLFKERPTLDQFINAGKILPVQIKWVKTQDLEINPRSGKQKRVIDRRTIP